MSPATLTSCLPLNMGTEHVVAGGTGTPPQKKTIAQNLFCVFPKGFKFTGMPGGEVPGNGTETDTYPGVLHAIAPAGQGVNPGRGKLPQYVPRPLWNVFPWDSLNVCHPDTDICVRGKRVNNTSWLRRRPGHKTETTFWAYSRPITNVSVFKYITPLPMDMDDEFLEVMANLRNTQRG